MCLTEAASYGVERATIHQGPEALIRRMVRSTGDGPTSIGASMKIQQTCVSIVMVSGVLSVVGCAFGDYAPHEAIQSDSTRGTSLTVSYKYLGSDGSIEPHPAPSYDMSQKPPSPTGEITLGGATDMPDVKTGTIKKTPPSRTDPASDPEGKRK